MWPVPASGAVIVTSNPDASRAGRTPSHDRFVHDATGREKAEDSDSEHVANKFLLHVWIAFQTPFQRSSEGVADAIPRTHRSLPRSFGPTNHTCDGSPRAHCTPARYWTSYWLGSNPAFLPTEPTPPIGGEP
jgi:hypothetical protein